MRAFFSIAGFAMNDLRKSMLPLHFEEQMFLNVNAHLWKSSFVLNEAVNNFDKE